MSLYPAATGGYYDRIYSRYTAGDIYGSTLLAGADAEKSVADWSAGTALAGFSTSGPPYGMMMPTSYEQFARNVFPPEVEMAAGAHGAVDEFNVSGGGRLLPVGARLKPEPEIVGGGGGGDTRSESSRTTSTTTTGSEMATTITAADTSGDDVIRLGDGGTAAGSDVDVSAGHVFAPDSDHHGHERQCLLWACKTCKKRSAAAVDRRKVTLSRLQIYAHCIMLNLVFIARPTQFLETWAA